MKHFRLTQLLCLIFTGVVLGCSEGNIENNDSLTAEKEILIKQQQIVENLKKQIETEQNRANTSIPLQIEGHQSQIGVLGAIAAQVREAQSDLSSAGTEALTRESLQAQQIQNQVLPQIQAIELSIPRTEEQITLLTSIGLRSKEQEARLMELKDQLIEQKTALENLRTQLNDLNIESISRSNQIYRTMSDQRRELASYKEDIQSELASEREVLSSLQANSLQSKMSLTTLNQQLKSAEVALDRQKKKVRAMENQNKQ